MALISLNNLERFFNNLKTYISNALSSKANSSHTHTSSDITDLTVDSALSSSSENPVQNKVVKNALDGKIPLAGTNALAGSIVPDTGASYDLGNSSYTFRRGHIAALYSGLLASSTDDSGVTIWGGNNWNTGAAAVFYGKNNTYVGAFRLRANDGTNTKEFIAKPDGTLTWGSKNVAMQEDVIPRSGGQVMKGSIHATANTNYFSVGHGWGSGGTIYFYNSNTSERRGGITIQPYLVTTPSDINNTMNILPGGTWTWNGTACQIVSDQRLKQQINAIDDKLLDAWQDVDLVQFKYNDSVNEKGDNARLHTGYVVQQIDKACKEHNVDISEYGLYCHEEYPEETEEVEVTHDDGTTTKERKVIREASEHYSLRYTEALIVECAYLRKQIKELEERLEKLEGNTK